MEVKESEPSKQSAHKLGKVKLPQRRGEESGLADNPSIIPGPLKRKKDNNHTKGEGVCLAKICHRTASARIRRRVNL